MQSNLLMVDNLAACFILVSIYFLIKRCCLWGGLFSALAFATRYSAWPAGAALMVSVLVLVMLGRVSVINWIQFSLLSVAGAFPFLMRNAFVNHNPIFPLAIGLFGPPGIHTFGGYFDYGIKLTPLGLLKLPWTFLFTSEFIQPIFDYTLGKIFIVQFIAGTALFFYDLRRKKININIENYPDQIFLVSFALIDLVIWLITAQQMRFLLPAILIVQGFLILMILRFATQKNSTIFLSLILLGGLASNINIHRSDLKDNFKDAFARAQPCMDFAEKNRLGAVGQLIREGSLGFFDQDFVFIGTHPYSVLSEEAKKEWPLYLYFSGPEGEAKRWGYSQLLSSATQIEQCKFLYRRD